MADDLARRFPENTVVRFIYLPVLRAQLALDHGDAAKAIEELQAAAPYEVGAARDFCGALHPVYVRGEAYLAMFKWRGLQPGVNPSASLRLRLTSPGPILS